MAEDRTKKLEEGLIACRQYIKMLRGAWWNDNTACDLMIKHINPALGLDPWDGDWIEDHAALEKRRAES